MHNRRPGSFATGAQRARKATPPGAAVLDALEAKNGHLLGDGMVTRDVINTRISHKREREDDPVRSGDLCFRLGHRGRARPKGLG